MATYRRRRVGGASLLLSLAAWTACSEAGATDDRMFSESDSAGVLVQAVDWDAVLASVDTLALDEPLRRVGVLDGDPGLQFDRIAEVVPLASAFAVVDAGSQDVRVFSLDGTLRDRFGGAGDGPGELGAITRAIPYRGDSIAVADRSGRITVFSSSGAFRTLRPDPGEGDRLGGLFDALPDGRFVAYYSGPLGDGLTRRPLIPLIHAPDGSVAREWAPLPGLEGYTTREANLTLSLAVPFGARTELIVSGDDVLTLDGASPGFTRSGAAGELVAIWRTNEPSVVIGNDFAEWYRDSVLAEFAGEEVPADMRSAFERSVTGMTFPEAAPFFTGGFVGTDGSIWLRRERPRSATDVFLVLDRTGHPSRFVREPQGSRIESATSSHVFAVHEDELGVDFVDIHALH